MHLMNILEMHFEKLSKDGGIYIICPDRLFAHTLMGSLEKYNELYPHAKVIWYSQTGFRVSNTRWSVYEERTVYCISKNSNLSSENKYILTYCDIDYLMHNAILENAIVYQARGFVQALLKNEKVN